MGKVLFIFLLSTAFFVLPSRGGDVYLSPDETANAVAAEKFRADGSFVVTESYNPAVPWVHPRSFVATPEGLVPVAFLGMPFLLSIADRIPGSFALLGLTAMLAISAGIPLWSFTRSWGRLGQIATVVGWMTFPTVILYANRGLFPNLVVVCLAMWCSWIVYRSRVPVAMVVAGALAGLALIIRPIEAAWVLPWIVGAYLLSRDRPRIRDAVWFGIPFAGLLMLGAWLGWKTYGSWFAAGYQLRDIGTPLPMEEGQVETTGPLGFFETWPFGFHPRNVLFNVRSYLVVYLLPWFLVSVAAVILAWKEKKARVGILLAAWTVVALSLIYGQALYQDHVRPNHVSLANSFLRYAIPVAVIAAASLGWCAVILQKRFQKYGTVLATVLIVAVGACGYWTAFARDDEGILQNLRELQKYEEVRSRTMSQVLMKGSVVLSERSDKIFFPHFSAASPLPSRERIRELVSTSPAPIALFLRTQTPEQLSQWEQEGILLKLEFTAGNESLYTAAPSI